MSLYWSVAFYYSDGTDFIVNNADYIDDITFIQLKKIIISSNYSCKFLLNNNEINDGENIKNYDNMSINIKKTKKVYNNITALIDGTPSIDINNKNIIKIIKTSNDVHVALTMNGYVISWYYNDNHHLNDAFNNVKNELINIIDIQNTEYGFAALTYDGNVITWGNEYFGGNCNYVKDNLNNVIELYSNKNSFVALKNDNSVVTWGGCLYNDHNNNIIINQNLLININSIYCTNNAFAVLTNEKKILTWGDNMFGGDSSHITNYLVNIKTVHSTDFAFAVLNENNTVYTWENDNKSYSRINNNYINDVICVLSSFNIFVAVKLNSIVVWGEIHNYLTSYDYTMNLNNYITFDDIQNVGKLYSNYNQLILLLNDNNVVQINKSDLTFENITDLIDVISITNTTNSFAALKKDNTVYTWGESTTLNNEFYNICGGDSSKVKDYLTDVEFLLSTQHAFAAIKKNKDVVVWGCNHNRLLNNVYNNIEHVFVTKHTFFLANEF